MPELPEVETIRRSLLPRLVGRRIAAVEVREPRLRRRIQRDFAARLMGRRIDAIDRRGKYLLVRLSGGESVLAHLGMSGALLLNESPLAPARHDHVRIGLSDGAELVLNDPRRFGLLKVAATDAVDALPELRYLGPDPLDRAFSTAQFAALLRRSRRPVKNLLLDQHALGGLGNIYANEALFRAGIRPTRRAGRVRRTEVAPFLDAIRAVLHDAVALGGSSIADYRDGNGRPGYFQLRLCVYDRAGDPCPRCATAVRRVVQSGRSSFYCPRCQR